MTVAEAGRQQTSDAAGEFTFAGLAFGAYTLPCRWPAIPTSSCHVTYEADSQIHNVILPGRDPRRPGGDDG